MSDEQQPNKLTYVGYLRLDQILNAQHPVVPDEQGPAVRAAEHFFIVTHQALIPQLADYVTRLLASPRAARLAHQSAYAAVLPYYLHQYLSVPDGTAGRNSWCQHTSLALAELLAEKMT